MNMTSSISSGTMGRGSARTTARGSRTIVPAVAVTDNNSEANSASTSYSSVTRDYSLPSSFAGDEDDDEGNRTRKAACAEHKSSMTSLISSPNQSKTTATEQQQEKEKEQRPKDMSQLNIDQQNEAISVSDRGGETTAEEEENDDAGSKDQLAVQISNETKPMIHLLRLLKEMDDGNGNFHAGSTDPKGKALASLIHDFENEISMIEHRVKDEYLMINEEKPQDPPPLPPNWIELEDPGSGDVYYANEATGQTQWERPVIANEVGDNIAHTDRRNNVHQQGYFDSSQHSDLNNSRASNGQSSSRSNDDQQNKIESSHTSDMSDSRTGDMQNSHLSYNFQCETSVDSNLKNSPTLTEKDQNSSANEIHSMRNSSTSNNFHSSKSSNIFNGNSSATMENSAKSNVNHQNELGGSITNFEDGHQVNSVTNSEKISPIDDLPPDWTALVDPDSGDTYYANELTGETTWDKPERKANDIPSSGSDDHLPAEWIALEDAQSGDTYYLNQVTMATTWDRPTANNEIKPSPANADPATAQLPPGWEAIYDPSCGEYFYAHESGETQWEFPEPDQVDLGDVKSDPQAPDDGDDAYLPSGWFAAVDEDSGDTYYCNEMTGETTWDIPTEAAVAHNAEGLHQTNEEEDDDLPPDWYAVIDQASGDTYFCNETTGETTWDRPLLLKDDKVAHELSHMSRLSMNDHTVYESDSTTSSQF